ncbi:MAG TPA: C40 family peptidase [Acidiferrobacteraceae bacterium]|nr:C40 family peptidase [Acidiferrobacteraceae bacterium]
MLGIVAFGTILAGCATWLGPHASRRQAQVAARVAMHLRGRPYRYGGEHPATGFDCSGLVHYSYARAGLNLPRTARALSHLGRPVSRYHLLAGDLVFFYEHGLPYGHVGVYVGRGRFVHAPAPGQRVTDSSLENPYWGRHWAGARRLW